MPQSKNGPKRGKPTLRVVEFIRKNQKKRGPGFTQEEVQYFRDLHEIVDAIYAEASEQYEWSWNQLAVHSGLAYETVVRLGERETKYPRFYTVQRLAAAVGWKLKVTEVQKAQKGKSKIKVA